MQLVHHFDVIKLTLKGFPFREMTYKNVCMMTSSKRGKKDSWKRWPNFKKTMVLILTHDITKPCTRSTSMVKNQKCVLAFQKPWHKFL